MGAIYSLLGHNKASAEYVEGTPFTIDIDTQGALLTLEVPEGLFLLFGGNGYNGEGALILRGATELAFTAAADDYSLQLKDENGADVGDPVAFTVSPASQTAANGMNMTRTAQRSGYTFIGWNTAPDGTGTSYADGHTFGPHDLTDDITLYAQWRLDTDSNPPVSPPPGDDRDDDDLPSDPPTEDDDDDQPPNNPLPGGNDDHNNPPAGNDGGGDGNNRPPTNPLSVTTPGSTPSPAADITPAPTRTPAPDLSPDQTTDQATPEQSSDQTPVPGSRELFVQDESPTDDELLFMLEDDSVPLFSFFDTPIPLFGSSRTRGFVWAVVNLILAIAGVFLALFAIIRMLARKKREDKSERDENIEAHQKRKKKNRKIWLTISIVMGAAGIIVFLLTEDTTKLMVLLDRWTIVNAGIFIIEAVGFGLAFNRKKKHDEDTAYHIEATPAAAG